MVPHILVIDDQISLPRFIAMELSAEGYHVSVNCDDVLHLYSIQELSPDLIVLNWELRRTSGQDMCRQIRQLDAKVPIVVVTSKDEVSCRAALAIGAQTCLKKPFSMEKLLHAIERHLNS